MPNIKQIRREIQIYEQKIDQMKNEAWWGTLGPKDEIKPRKIKKVVTFVMD